DRLERAGPPRQGAGSRCDHRRSRAADAGPPPGPRQGARQPHRTTPVRAPPASSAERVALAGRRGRTGASAWRVRTAARAAVAVVALTDFFLFSQWVLIRVCFAW